MGQTTKFTNGLQKTTIVRHRMQSVLMDYKRLQKLDIDYKVYYYTTKGYYKSL